MRKHLLFKLRPCAAGDHCDFDDLKQPRQKRRHFGVERQFAFRERAVEIEYDQSFHG